MTPPSPTITIHLDGRSLFQLGRKGFAGTMPAIIIQMHDKSEAAIVALPGYHPPTKTFSLPLALQSGLFDLFNTETGTKLSVGSSSQGVEELVVKSGARNQWFDLTFDPCGDFWTQLLTPGNHYEVRWGEYNATTFAYRRMADQDAVQQLPVHRMTSPIKLTALADTATPPRFSMSLTPTADICSLSGNPPFGFELRVTSHEKEVITVCLHKEPLKELHGLEEIAEVVNEEGEEIEWPWGIGCWEYDEPFPDDFTFEEFHPGVPYERTFWLEKVDKRTANGGELDDLEAGRSYKARISRELLVSFSKWRRGNKEELLAGGLEEKRQRWNGGSEQILFEVSEPFTFKAI